MDGSLVDVVCEADGGDTLLYLRYIFRTQTWRHVAASNCALMKMIPEASSNCEVKSNEDWLLWKSE
jgi:hypothetical protein